MYDILKKRIKNTFLLLTLVFSSPVWAVVSYQNVIDWVSDELGSAITIESGQYGQSDLDRVRNLIPPGYFDEFDFPELSMEIMPTNRYQAHELYLNATKKFSGQAFLSKTGELENYTAGMPFSREQILAESSQSSGLMVAVSYTHLTLPTILLV